MLDAFLLGLLAASSLVVGAVIATRREVPTRTLGLVLAFGSGILISSVAYELVAEAATTAAGEGGVGLGLGVGALAFFFGDLLIDRGGGAGRRPPGDEESASSSMAIILGTVLDGIPESIVLGVGLLSGTGASVAMVVAVFASNLPEAMASTAGLRRSGWSSARLLRMWSAITLMSATAAAVGYAAFDGASPSVIAFVLAFAAGAVLTMLADSMMPEAFAHGGPLAGVVTTLAFGTGFLLAELA